MSTEAIERFRTLLRIPTISSADPERVDSAAFDRFHNTLVELYPRVHEHLHREVLDGHALLYRWVGATRDAPTILMAHQDVVSVTEAEWTSPPFDAELAGVGLDAEIRARGAIDDKGSLVAIMEAVESMLEEGYAPPADVYLAFGHNEEVAGGGAAAIVEALAARGVQPALVLDEGGAIVDGALPGVDLPTAMVGVSERGVMTIDLEARSGGGHASTPPTLPPAERLARALTRIHRRGFAPRLSAPVRAMFATVAALAPQPMCALYAHAGALGAAFPRALSRLSPETNAMVRTTAVATELSAADGENVLPTAAHATLNVRVLPGETTASVLARLRRVVRDPEVTLTLRHGSEPSPVSPWRGPQWRRIAGAVHDVFGPDVLTTPYLQLGASDSRFFTRISENVYRFTPFHLTRAERDALHSHNERIRVEVWLRGIQFYRALIAA